MSSTDSHATGLKPVLRYRDLVLFYLVAIFGIRMVPMAASIGPSVVVLWFMALACFYVPMALTVADLTSRFPGEGGIYIWSKKAFGDFHGFMTAWTYWTACIVYFPSLLLFSSTQVALVVPGYAHLADSRLFVTSFSIATVLFILALNILGLRVATRFHNLAGVLRFVVVGIVVGLGVLSWAKFGSATDLSFQAWIPNLDTIKDLVFLSTLAYMFSGFEGASMLGEEVHDAKKNIPRAVVSSGILITSLYVAASVSLFVAISADELTGLQGFSSAIAVAAHNLGGETFATWATSITILLIALMTIGGTSVWFTATARLPFVIGLDRYLPPAFGKLHPRFRTPHVALAALAAATIGIVILSGLGGKAEQVYSVLISLEIIIYFIPYLYMFASLIKLESSRSEHHAARVPGGRLTAIVGGGLGFLVTAGSLVLALIPGEGVENPRAFYLAVFGSLGANLALGVGFYLVGRGKRSNA